MDTDVYRLEIEHANRRAAVLASTKRQEVAYRHVVEPDDDQITRDLVAQWVTAIQAEQEEMDLIRLLRDQTHSKEIFDRCVAIVGRE